MSSPRPGMEQWLELRPTIKETCGGCRYLTSTSYCSHWLLRERLGPLTDEKEREKGAPHIARAFPLCLGEYRAERPRGA